MEQEPSSNDNTCSASLASLPSWSGWSERWSRTVRRLQNPIVTSVQFLAQLSSKYPKRTIVGSILLSFFLLAVGLATNVTLNTEAQLMWAPFGSSPNRHQHWITDDSGFPEPPLTLDVLCHSSGRNVLAAKNVEQVFEVVAAIQQLREFELVCGGRDDACNVFGVVEFWGSNYTTFKSQGLSDKGLSEIISRPIYPNGVPVVERATFGTTTRNENGTLVHVAAYFVRLEFPRTDLGESLETAALETTLRLREKWEDEDNNMYLDTVTEKSFADEAMRVILNDIVYVPLGFIIMTLFAALVFRSSARRQGLLAVGAVASVLLAMMTSFGMMFIIGVPMTSVTQILPFVTIGVGLDDALVMYGAFGHTKASKTPEERIKEMIDEVGLSIVLTTITSSLAFGLGCISTIPVVYWLCLYACPTMLLVLLYQLTFFVACMTVDEHRFQKGYTGCCPNQNAVDTSHVEVDVDTGMLQLEDSRLPTNHVSRVDRFMASYSHYVLRSPIKVVVVVAFTALLGGCIYSATLLEQQFKPTDTLDDDSYAASALDALHSDFYTVLAPYAFFRDIDQSSKLVREQTMYQYLEDLASTDIVPSVPEYCWFLDFDKFVASDDRLSNQGFAAQLDAFLSIDGFRTAYESEIVRNAAGNVTVSRCRVQLGEAQINNVHFQMDFLRQLQQVDERQPVNQGSRRHSVFIYDDYFLLIQFYIVLQEELAVTTILAVGAVTFVASVFMPHPSAALVVLPLTLILYVDLLGLMQASGMHIDMFIYITLLLSIGLFVDYIIHFLLRYYEAPSTSREGKVRFTLQTIGPPVLLAGISTILGTLPLLLTSSTVFRTICLNILFLATLGVGHGLILLPVVLATIGPQQQQALCPEDDNKLCADNLDCHDNDWHIEEVTA